MNWTQTFSALLTPTIAILGSYIAWRQWKTAQNKLKLDLFNRRLSVFEATEKIIGTVFREGIVTEEDRIDFLRGTKNSKWLFNSDISDYLQEELHGKIVDLQQYTFELKGNCTETERIEKIREQAQTKKWIVAQYKVIDDKFMAFLGLSHL